MRRNKRVRVKFCGITRAQDASDAIMLGVDAIGFVFCRASPRYISPSAAQSITQGLPPFVSKVGLFVDADPDTVCRTVDQVGIDVVQYHGNETPDQCLAGGRPFIKVVRMKNDADVIGACRQFVRAAAILLDTYDRASVGGTGTAFDWTRIPDHVPKPLILAGGLTPVNVASAIRQVLPYGVDVSGGIEFSKGIKDLTKMRIFLDEVNKVEC